VGAAAEHLELRALMVFSPHSDPLSLVNSSNSLRKEEESSYPGRARYEKIGICKEAEDSIGKTT
jgi:hypothetical protein